MKHGVTSNSNFLDFHKRNNEILSDGGNSGLTEFQSFLVLQNIVWLEWCYTHGHPAIFTGEFSEEEKMYRTDFLNNKLGLSMNDAIVEKLNEEKPFIPIEKIDLPNEQSSGQIVVSDQVNTDTKGTETNGRTQEN